MADILRSQDLVGPRPESCVSLPVTSVLLASGAIAARRSS